MSMMPLGYCICACQVHGDDFRPHGAER
jgi:hypothetical protein